LKYIGLVVEAINGEEVVDRTGTGTFKVFGKRIVHDMSEGFPLLTTKKIHFRSVIGELLWFLKGTEDAQFLIDNKITIWDEWFQDGPDGTKVLPHTYGVKWRDFDGVDQLRAVVESIRNNPTSRRHVVSAWDPRNVSQAALPWCHVMFQFNVRQGRWLDISVYQRSVDLFLGCPFNLASYGALLSIVAKLTNLIPGEMIYNFGDCHVYKNHLSACVTQLQRDPKSLPTLNIPDSLCELSDLENLMIEDFEIVGYNPHPAIKADVSV
jgi:thymidylate synthase